MFKNLHGVVCVVLGLLICLGVSHANESFNYSYTYSNGTKISGSFEGVANGNLVTDLSNITLEIKGIPYNPVGNLQAYAFDFSSPDIWVKNKAVASFDGFATNFLFTDSASPSGNDGNVFFYIAPGTIGSKTVASGLHVGGQMYYDSPRDYDATHWSLTTAVPEPETYAMMLAGLGLIGAVTFRRTAKQV